MPRSKRAYVPKIKGCHECSKRRIHCDRTQPSCLKCATRGIPCSGFGIRYRFNDDVVSKGRINENRKFQLHQYNPESHTESGRLGGKQTVFALRPHNIAGPNNFIPSFEEACFDLEHNEDEVLDFIDNSICDSSSALDEIDCLYNAQQWEEDPSEETAELCTTSFTSIDAWQQFFLLYFSDKIALEMVVLDNQLNGWRHLVLPLAHSDELVRNAVLSTSAFHFTSNVNDSLYNPDYLYHKTIRSLHERQDLESHDTSGKQGVLISLLVLLVASMVNGTSDFRTILRLLESALEVIGGEDTLTGELGTFLVRQIRKFRNYAKPLINQAEAVHQMALTATFRPSRSDGWECFRSYFYAYPAFESSMQKLYDLNEQACNIYVSRVEAGPHAPPLTHLVDQFIDVIETIPPDAPGQHILVWSIFLTASESATPEHQQYFTELLLKHYRRNGFVNILRALEHLQTRWNTQIDRNWTESLEELPVFIV